uniref:Transmembrane 4 L six family member 4 n=1 Tax=Gadus morhua TaxID=8049 RepID=A0A8C5F676_GADMO
MCPGAFAKCLGISLLPLSVVCVLCNILLFFPGGTPVDTKELSEEVWYFGGILGSGVLNNDCCGCCGNMLSSILFAAVGVLGAGYSVVVSVLAIKRGPFCQTSEGWKYPFENRTMQKDYLWKECLQPLDVVHWNLSLFSVLLALGLIQAVLCAVQVVNGLLGALCGDCCGGSRGVSVNGWTA